MSTPVPPNVTRMRGTQRKDRPRERVVVEPHIDDVELETPDWLTDRAAALWRQKLDAYRKRGQSVGGCRSTLAIYCQLEDELIAAWEAGTPPPASGIQAFRQLAASFYDVPSAQVQTVKPTPTPNPFTRRTRK